MEKKISNSALRVFSKIGSVDEPYFIVNRRLLLKLGPAPVIFLTELFTMYKMVANCEALDEYGGFFITIGDMEKYTSIKRGQQNRCIRDLKEIGFIKVVARKTAIDFTERRFYIVFTAIEKFLKDDLTEKITGVKVVKKEKSEPVKVVETEEEKIKRYLEYKKQQERR